MKLLHCSDLHLGKRPFGSSDYSNKRYEDYFKAFDYIVECAIEEKVDVFLIAGDFFDKKELLPDALGKTEKILEKLSVNHIKVLLIEGNHDNIVKGSEANSWLDYLEKKSYFTRLKYHTIIEKDEKKYIFDKISIKGINFFGLGYPGHNVDEIMEELSKELNDKEQNIILVHTAIADSDFLAGTVSRNVIDSFKGKALYIAGGHFHSFYQYPEENPYFFLPGSSEFWNIQNEVNQKKGFILFDTETKTAEHHFSLTRNRLNLIYEIESKNSAEFSAEFDKLIENLDLQENEDVLILKLKLKENFYINLKECEEKLKNLGALQSFIKVIYPKFNQEMREKEFLTTEEIEENIIKEWEVFGNNAQYTVDMLKKLKENQDEKNRDIFLENFDLLLEYFISSEKKEGGCENAD